MVRKPLRFHSRHAGELTTGERAVAVRRAGLHEGLGASYDYFGLTSAPGLGKLGFEAIGAISYALSKRMDIGVAFQYGVRFFLGACIDFGVKYPTVRKATFAKGLNELICLDPTTDSIWPGSILSAETIATGGFATINLPRSPLLSP